MVLPMKGRELHKKKKKLKGEGQLSPMFSKLVVFQLQIAGILFESSDLHRIFIHNGMYEEMVINLNVGMMEIG